MLPGGGGQRAQVVPPFEGGDHPAGAAVAGDLDQALGRPAIVGILQVEAGQGVRAMRIEAGRIRRKSGLKATSAGSTSRSMAARNSVEPAFGGNGALTIFPTPRSPRAPVPG